VRKSPYNLLLLIICAFSAFNLSAQSNSSGTTTFDFLNFPNSARIAALGGSSLSLPDPDITLTLANPSLISADNHNQIGLSFVDYYSDVNYGSAQFGRTFDKLGSFVGTMQFVNYGTFTRMTNQEINQGTFGANELALNIGWGRRLDSSFSIGANFKGIYSSFDSYSASGLAVDVAGTWHLPDYNFMMSVIAHNIGIQLTNYTTGTTEKLPFELQLAMSKRLAHVPLTFSVVLTNLQNWDLGYESQYSTEVDPFTGEKRKTGGLSGFADELMRHVIIGAELQPFKSFRLQVAYNYQTRQEMKIVDKVSTVGFSWGFGFRVYGFSFSYARATNHLSGSPNYVTITTNLGEAFK